jgi:hypothetical protein
MARKRISKPIQPYTLPERSGLKPDTVRVLAFDPGIVNFGISVVAARGSKIKVMANAKVMHPMTQMNEFQIQKLEFLEEIAQWVDLYKPHALIAERFMLRGAGTGQAMGELIPSMIALVSAEFKLNTLTIPAAQWKNPIQKRFTFDLKETYKEIGVEAHQLDSAFIGIYGIEKGLGKQFKFGLTDVMKQVEDSSLLPLKIRRRR